jgi:tetratricopeptide (TPR) repeat protein
VTYDAVAALHVKEDATDADTEALDSALDELTTRGLVHQATQPATIRPATSGLATSQPTPNPLIPNPLIPVFDLHPIVRRYAYDRLTAADKQGTHAQLADYFAAVPKPQKVTALADLAPVIELYHHLVRAGKLDEACDLYYDRLADKVYFEFGSYNTEIELLRALFLDGEDQPPRLKKEGDQAWALTALANSYSLSGQPRRAVPLFEMQNAICEKAGDKENLAIGLGNVAQIQLVIGELSAAQRNLRRYIELSISSSRKGLNMRYLALTKETKSHVQAHSQGYSKNSI